MLIHSLPLGAALEAVKIAVSLVTQNCGHKRCFIWNQPVVVQPRCTHTCAFCMSLCYECYMRVFVYYLYWSVRDTSGDINVCRLTNEDERHLQNCSENHFMSIWIKLSSSYHIYTQKCKVFTSTRQNKSLVYLRRCGRNSQHYYCSVECM